MKISIITEGNNTIGFGHVTRCYAIFQALIFYGFTPSFIVNDTSITQKILNNSLFMEIDNGQIPECDILIIDSYLKDKKYYQEASKSSKLLVSFDDFDRLSYPSGVVINSSIGAKLLHYSKKNRIKYLLGSKFQPLRKAFWDVPKKTINREIRTVLITLGGMQDEFIIKLAQHISEYSDFQIKLVLSRNHVLQIGKNITPYFWLNDDQMIKLYLESDICISGGGQTLYELARLGVPALAICYAENQVLNIKGWNEAGFIQYAGWYNDKTIFEEIRKTIVNFDYDKRLRSNKIGSETIDGQGALRIVECLKETLL